MHKNNIAIGSDHGGYHLMKCILGYLLESGYGVENFSLPEASLVDYPKIAISLAKAVASSKFEKGILICGTGIGMSIVANKILGIRAALCDGIFAAKKSREHNNANILVLGGRVIGEELACEIVKTWLDTSFSGGRHERRLALIDELEREIRKDG